MKSIAILSGCVLATTMRTTDRQIKIHTTNGILGAISHQNEGRQNGTIGIIHVLSRGVHNYPFFLVTISDFARTTLIWKKYVFEDIWCIFFLKYWKSIYETTFEHFAISN